MKVDKLLKKDNFFINLQKNLVSDFSASVAMTRFNHFPGAKEAIREVTVAAVAPFFYVLFDLLTVMEWQNAQLAETTIAPKLFNKMLVATRWSSNMQKAK